jgi:iron complex outermembrane receptor protein
MGVHRSNKRRRAHDPRGTATAILSVGALTLTTPTFAQTAATEGSDSQNVTEIVVTGSRIVRNDYAAESPIVTVSADQLTDNGPQQLQTIFNTMPQFAARNGAATNSEKAQGRDNANLRGLGPQRTLVLLDGRRMQPSDPLGPVDLNTVPTMLLESVEVITGGASAVYGSDAIAGVVNFKLKRDFEGLMVSAQHGQTWRGDGDTQEIGVLFGSNLADGRGNAVLSLNYNHREFVPMGVSDFFKGWGGSILLTGATIRPNGANLPTQAAMNEVFMNRYGSTVAPVRNQVIGVNSDNTLFTQDGPILNNRYPEWDPYIERQGRVTLPIQDTFPLQQPMDRFTAFASGHYQVTDNVEAYLQINHTEYTSEYTRLGLSVVGTAAQPLSIPVTNPFIPDDLAYILASRANPNEPATVVLSSSKVGPTKYENNYEVNQYVLGLRGDLPFSDWTWDVYGSQGRMLQTDNMSGYIDYQAFQQLLNAPDGGASICPGGFNVFSSESLSNMPGQEGCFDYLHRSMKETTELRQELIDASAQGRLFSLPAGDVRLAVGASYRRSTFDYSPDRQRIARTVIPNQPTGPAKGADQVKEVFAEALIPIVSDLPLVRDLSLDVAYRYSDYELSGGIDTYKVSLDWSVVQGLRFRGGYQRAVRAPSLGELFAPAAVNTAENISTPQLGGGDPCDVAGNLRNPARNPNAAQVRDLCLATGVPVDVIDIHSGAPAVNGVGAGNLALKPETADTFTAGFVWQSSFDSPWLSRLTTTVDYYSIEVEDAIGVISGIISLGRCFNDDGISNPTYSPSNFYCTLTTRDGAGRIDEIRTPTMNLSGYRTSGIDAQIDWGFVPADAGFDAVPGSFSLSLAANYLQSYEIQTLANAPFLDFAGTIGNTQVNLFTKSYPEWKVTASLGYEIGDVTMRLAMRWYDSMSNAANVGTNGTQPGVASTAYFDLTGRWLATDSLELRAGIINIADKDPPNWTSNGATDPALYDVMGRRFYIGLNKTF